MRPTFSFFTPLFNWIRDFSTQNIWLGEWHSPFSALGQLNSNWIHLFSTADNIPMTSAQKVYQKRVEEELKPILYR
jgi:hypothetical protein